MDNNEKILDEEPSMLDANEVEDQDIAQEIGAGDGEEERLAPLAEETAEEITTAEILSDDLPPDDLPHAEAADGETPSVEVATAEAASFVGVGPSDEEFDKQLFLSALNGEAQMDEGEFMFAPLQRGQIIKGTVAGKSDMEILVDVGAKSEGLITGRELELLEEAVVQGLQVGDEIYVYVLTPEDREGRMLLSLRRALEEQDWRTAEEYLKAGHTHESRIAGYNKGGLIVPFGKVRGFVPASQVSMERRRRSDGTTPEERWGDMVGEKILTRVIEVDRGRNRLILSERATEQEQRKKRRAELLESLEVGQRRRGRVVRLTDFGAFVDLGGADGLVHLSELSWKHVNHPREVLHVGEEIEVEVISLDREQQRIGLSLKNCLADPWDSLAAEYRPGQLVQGRVTKMTKFGAFASLVDRPEIEGLIHISELSDRRVKHPREVVNEDDILTLRIIRIEPERRRLGLSLRQVDSEEYIEEDWQDLIGADDAGEGE